MAETEIQPEPKRKTIGDLPIYLARILPFWGTPAWFEGQLWRNVVNRQMLAKICRDLLIMQVIQVNWEIKARDSNQADELKDSMVRHTDILLEGGGEGYEIMMELFLKDVLDIPFGGALEQVRDPSSRRLEALMNVDGATLVPTPNWDFPVVQSQGIGIAAPVLLARDEVARIYLSPRTPIRFKGWGMAPPEKIYLALELIGRGDRYYANLLLDTPPAGLLDLLDIEESAAILWAESFRELMVGTEAFKIPVLYEHDKPAVYLPFGRPPAEMTFETTILQYAGLACAGYGMTLSDLGLGRTQLSLAGSIREERRSRRLGFGNLLMKMERMFNRILPSELEFKHIYDDEETLIARGRSRLTNARAFTELIKTGVMTKKESQDQLVADGLVTITLAEPEEESELELAEERVRKEQEAHMVGKPVPPSEGGRGEIKTVESKRK